MKMCDFGISGYLVDSVAKTLDAGCKPYMAVSAPARGSGERCLQDQGWVLSSVCWGQGCPEALHFLPQQG